MRAWFRAKYIECSEHERAMAQYARLVSELRVNLELLQIQTYELQYILSQRKRTGFGPRAQPSQICKEENVVHVDFRNYGN